MEPDRITVQQVRERLDRGDALVLVDARSAHAWDESDVKARGAVRVPPDDVASRVSAIARDKAVVTYCT